MFVGNVMKFRSSISTLPDIKWLSEKCIDIYLNAEFYRIFDVIFITGTIYQEITPISIKRYSKSFHHVVFDDIDCPLNGYKLASESDIALALAFADGAKHTIIVCKYGKTRSASIAYLLKCQKENNPEKHLSKFTDSDIHLNKHIIKLGSEILNKPNIFDVYQKFETQKKMFRNITKLKRDNMRFSF